MTAHQSPQTGSERREAAAAWLVRLQSETATEQDWVAFEAWLADPANKTAVEAIESIVGEIDARAGEIAPALSRRAAARWSTRRLTAVVGAGIAAALVVGVVLVSSLQAPTPATVAYSTQGDATRVVELADGSTIHLNRGSSIDVMMTRDARRVSLARGEAAFTVTHDAARPFIVSVGETSIRDVGTEFNVLKRTATLTVSVRAGAVEMKGQGLGPVTIRAGDALVFDQTEHTATLLNANADDAFSWQEGRLVFHNATLAEIVGDLNRYSATPIRIDDPRAADLRFSGVLMIQDPADLVSQLQAFLPVRSEMSKGEILLRGR